MVLEMESYNSSRELMFFPQLGGGEMRECDSVARAAFEHLGKSYRITRELKPGLVDCSTIISQAHWVGAAVQTPFIAESQRRAANAVAVDRGDLLPGDAIYAYSSHRHSPGGRHNHVVMYVGEDSRGISWVVESREGPGAQLIKLGAVQFNGGIRRFCVQPFHAFPSGDWSFLVRRVPKLGRLGCRLTAQYGASRRHRGTDIYAQRDWAVVSPFAGTIVTVFKTKNFSDLFVGIWSAEQDACSLVGPIKIASNIGVGAQVESGQLLGGLGEGAGPGGCNVIAHPPGIRHVHWELWSRAGSAVSPAGDLRCDWLPRQLSRQVELRAQNAIYELKCGKIGTCVSGTD